MEVAEVEELVGRAAKEDAGGPVEADDHHNLVNRCDGYLARGINR